MTLLELDRVEVTVGAPAHGGHCVARHEGMVLFVRHALPGERVIAEVTEVHRGYVRADAVEILEASPDRVPAPCPWSGPNACGGCDLQHVSPSAQLQWKASVVQELLARFAHLDQVVRVEQLPSPVGADGEPDTGWRTRVRYTVDAEGRAGLRKHRSHEVVPIERCMIAHPGIRALPVLDRTWSTDAVETVAPSSEPAFVVTDPARPIVERAVGHDFTLAAGGFWQVHPAAAQTLADAVIEQLAPKPGETAWDLYGGAGLFAAALADHLGVTGQVTLVESAPDGVAAARQNLAQLPVRILESTVERALAPRRGKPAVNGPVDLVVLDPPRTGAGKQVVTAVAASGARAVSYVACDPAALARDLATFAGLGWELAQLRAFDCFPFTHHVECVALLVPAGS
ncbi:MAG: class I SAM-dependent RNA methyltransferase [Hamadaea sp.]|uniref:class I SAM-dependent RNA methyltransferase n=1 Tax=Hamadaea sp. TaxID=2024425 RepID=UPI00184DCD35|nr:TRAM domain-containing protein [Hamadaea sp.]NUR72105.1 class I SAM-dependent RNA methyltransferase [Hamadaea sp.]NUT19670.1 class I SAM-dependent RNA methyltransferase [Hamadaea sp.]